jgi:hypothetical protein
VANPTPGRENLRARCQTSTGKRICSCPNCPPPLQAIGSAVPESAGYKASGVKVWHARWCVRERVRVRWAPGVGANGGARRSHAKPRHAPSRDRRSRGRQHITRGFHSMHTRVHSYSWSGGPHSYSTAVILQLRVLGRSGATSRGTEGAEHQHARAQQATVEVWSGTQRACRRRASELRRNEGMPCE